MMIIIQSIVLSSTNARKYIYHVLEFNVGLLCVSFLFKLMVSSLRKRDHFLAYLYTPLPTVTHDTKLQFREYRSLEGDTICVCALPNLW